MTPPALAPPPARRTAACPSRLPGRSRAPSPRGELCLPDAPARGRGRWHGGGRARGDAAWPAFRPHVVEDPLRVLGARIVRREDRDVREAHGHRAHGGPLAAVA